MNEQQHDSAAPPQPARLEVRDRPAEVGINLNTIFTAVGLMVLVWVGRNIEQINDKLGSFAVALAVTQQTVTAEKQRLDDHIADHRVHRP